MTYCHATYHHYYRFVDQNKSVFTGILVYKSSNHANYISAFSTPTNALTS